MTRKRNKDRNEDEKMVLPVIDEQGQEAAVLIPDSEEVGQLSAALEQKTREAAEANEKYLRTYADFENYRKRMQRDLAEFRKYANEQLALELLTVVDHLGLALKHAGEAGETTQGLQEGVELVYKQFRDVLEKFGVKAFAAEGEPFDPARHDALMQVENEDVPENTVVQVLQDGYLYNDKVLRHAKVGVSKRSTKSGTAEREKSETVNGGSEIGDPERQQGTP
jgi:molecular chaperone GrpE